MHENSLPAVPSLTLRGVPPDVVLVIKHAVTEYNVSHPREKITLTDVVSVAVREWNGRGGLLPKARE